MTNCFLCGHYEEEKICKECCHNYQDKYEPQKLKTLDKVYVSEKGETFSLRRPHFIQGATPAQYKDDWSIEKWYDDNKYCFVIASLHWNGETYSITSVGTRLREDGGDPDVLQWIIQITQECTEIMQNDNNLED